MTEAIKSHQAERRKGSKPVSVHLEHERNYLQLGTWELDRDGRANKSMVDQTLLGWRG
jgi:hypothetical protein